MAQLYFRYSTMNAGKSIEVLKTVHNYEEQQKGVLLFTSAYDIRFAKGYVASRIGIQKEARIITEQTDLINEVRSASNKVFCVVVDEAQFLKEKQVFELSRIVDEQGIPVICYGLKNDFKNQLFEGSEALLRFADKIEEIKTVCSVPSCERKATMVLRLENGNPVYEGEQIKIGGNESYASVCRKHYYHFDGR